MSEERFVSPGSPVPPDVRELLECLIEECAEVQQRCTKALRFGLDEVQPGQAYTNAQRISGELGDLMEVALILAAGGTLEQRDIDAAMAIKRVKLRRFLQHATV